MPDMLSKISWRARAIVEAHVCGACVVIFKHGIGNPHRLYTLQFSETGQRASAEDSFMRARRECDCTSSAHSRVT